MSETNPEGTERRRHPRLSPAIDVLGYEGSAGVSPRELTDLSRGGLRLVTTGPEQPGARVRIRLALRPGDEADPQQLDLGGQVVWARQAAPFHAGIRFVGLSEATRALLARITAPAG